MFVGFNAAFDWMFVADYFERYLGRNPFGYTALDIKAFAMGRLGGTWADTSMSVLGPEVLVRTAAGASRSFRRAGPGGALPGRCWPSRRTGERTRRAMTETTPPARRRRRHAARRVRAAARHRAGRGRHRALARGDDRARRASRPSDIVIDEKDGVFGHRVSMLDFSPTRPGPVPPDRADRRGEGARGGRRGRAGTVGLRRAVEDPDPPR